LILQHKSALTFGSVPHAGAPKKIGELLHSRRKLFLYHWGVPLHGFCETPYYLALV